MPQGIPRHPQFGLRIPAELLAKLRFIANENGRSSTKEIEQLIIRHIKQFEEDFFEITEDDIARLK